LYTDLPYLISLTQVPQVGSIQARILLQHFGSAEQIFKSTIHDLENIEGIGRIRAHSIKSFRNFSIAEKEMAFMQRYGIRALNTLGGDYPQRLLTAPDAPILLFYKGNADLNNTKTISIVGTRRNSDYGKQITEKIIRDLAAYDVLIFSGLAFGIAELGNECRCVAPLVPCLRYVWANRARRTTNLIG